MFAFLSLASIDKRMKNYKINLQIWCKEDSFCIALCQNLGEKQVFHPKTLNILCFYCILFRIILQITNFHVAWTQYEFLFVGRDEGNFVENYAYDLERTPNAPTNFLSVLKSRITRGFRADWRAYLIPAAFSDLETDAYLRFWTGIKEVNKQLRLLKWACFPVYRQSACYCRRFWK